MVYWPREQQIGLCPYSYNTRSEMYAGVLPPGDRESRLVCAAHSIKVIEKDGTDGRMDAGSLHYAYR